MLETNQTMERLSAEIKDPQKSQRSFRTKITIAKIESSVDGLISRMEGTGEVITDLEDGTVEIILSEQLRENRMKKKKSSLNVVNVLPIK